MNNVQTFTRDTGFAKRGYHAVYREQEVNHCPGCGQTHWLVGRFSAECAHCATALPLADTSLDNRSSTIRVGQGGGLLRPLSTNSWAA